MFDTLSENLKSLGYDVSCFATKEEATAYLSRVIENKSVGFGGSVTIAEMGLYDALATHNDVFWHQGVTDYTVSVAQRRAAAMAHVYISSVNGIAETGEIINIDGNGNRVSATLWGHEKVYFVVGKNKIAPDCDAAISRARNVAAPKNAKRLNKKTPCVVSGHCHNCKSPDRICRALCVLWEKPTCCPFEVVLIDEELGY